MEIEFTIRISPEERKQQLYASIGFSACYILLAVLLGSYIPLLLWLFGLICSYAIYLAFKPYLKLRAQEKCPDQLQMSRHNLIYFSKGKKALSVPMTAIAKVQYDEGIIIYLKKPVSERLEIIDGKLFAKPKKGDFYLEWFEPKAFALVQSELHDIMHPDEPN